MKNLIKVILLSSFLFVNTSYASDYEIDTKFMENEDVDYGSFSSKSNEKSVETEEKYEYNIDINNYVVISYTNTKTVKEKKWLLV